VSARIGLLTLVAVLGGPLAWIGQLVFAYSFEEAACAPGDGSGVWGLGAHPLHVVVGAVALTIALLSLAAALLLRNQLGGNARGRGDRTFLTSFGVLGASVFTLTIVLTGIGSTVLSTCHRA